MKLKNNESTTMRKANAVFCLLFDKDVVKK
jgi:hypothetical protein